jgi:hypothetical protein
MAITLVGTVTGGATNGGDVTLDLSSISLLENDVVFVVGGTGNSGTAATVETSGYTEILATATSQIDFTANYKRMGVSPDTSVVCNGGASSSDGVVYVAYVLRGVDTTTAMDATRTVNVSGGDPNTPSITTVTDGAWVFSVFTSESAGVVNAAPTGYLSLLNIARGGTNPAQAGAAYRAVSPAGAENPSVWDTGFGAGTDYISASIAFRPAVAGLVNDGVFSATGTATVTIINDPQDEGLLEAPLLSTVSFKGTAAVSSPFSMTGTGTATWTGDSFSNQPVPFSITATANVSFIGAIAQAGAISATGTITPDFTGGSINDVLFAHTGTWTVSFAGGTSNMTSVREVIESRGAATVRIGR